MLAVVVVLPVIVPVLHLVLVVMAVAEQDQILVVQQELQEQLIQVVAVVEV